MTLHGPDTDHSPTSEPPDVGRLEAIFLSTFVLIGQNRQAAYQQAKADHDFVEEEQELKENTQLTREIADLTKQIHDLTREVRDRIAGEDGGPASAAR